jgi:hypothetical protein
VSSRLRALAPAVAWLALPALAGAYPGGTPTFVTDVAPFCANCHSSVSADQLAGLPEARVQAELAPSKHLVRIREARPDGPYGKLSPAARAALLEGIAAIDAATRVTLSAPGELAAGQEFEASVEVVGGGGPVVGIALVDAAHRLQARPATSAGFLVLAKPVVRGPDGRPQSRFTDGRNPALAPGTTYVNVYDVVADPVAGKFSTVGATWRLRAPAQPGTYPLAAVLLYGTEKGSPGGSLETLQGRQPLGGYGSAAGRVRFSDVAQIRVK